MTTKLKICEEPSQQVVDALGAGGRRAAGKGVCRELGPDLRVVQDQPVAVVGHRDLVRGLHVGGRREIGGNPGCQPDARVGADRKLRPVQRPQRGVPPVEVGAPVRAQKRVGDADLEDGEPSRGLQMHGLPDVELEVGVRAADALAGVDVDGGHQGYFTFAEARRRWSREHRRPSAGRAGLALRREAAVEVRRKLGQRRRLLHPGRPAGIVDVGHAGAAVNVSTLALA